MSQINDLPLIVDKSRDSSSTQPRVIISNDHRWADFLWPCMAWLIFGFNVAVAISFVKDLFWLEAPVYDYAKHITTISTMCASYLAVSWVHQNVIRNYGRLD